MTRMLCDIIHGVPLREAILVNGSDWFSKRKALEWSKDSDEVVIGRRVSPVCYIDDAFPASLYLAWKYADDFENAAISNTNVGGDNCHRGAVIGALVGGAVGLSAIPIRYIDQIDDAARLRSQIDSIVTHS